MKESYSVNITKELDGSLRVDVWDSYCTMYPVARGIKFYGYTLEEVKKIVRKEFGLRYKHIYWFGSATK